MSQISTSLQRVIAAKKRADDTLDRATIAIIAAPFKLWVKYFNPTESAILLAGLLGEVAIRLYDRLDDVADHFRSTLTFICRVDGGALSSCNAWADVPAVIWSYVITAGLMLLAAFAAICLNTMHHEYHTRVWYSANARKYALACLVLVVGLTIGFAISFGMTFLGHLGMPGQATGAENGNDLWHATQLTGSDWHDAHGIQSEFRPLSGHDCLLQQYENDTPYYPCD